MDFTKIVHETFSDGVVNPGRVIALKAYIDQYDLTDEEYGRLMMLIDSYVLSEVVVSGLFKMLCVSFVALGVYGLL